MNHLVNSAATEGNKINVGISAYSCKLIGMVSNTAEGMGTCTTNSRKTNDTPTAYCIYRLLNTPRPKMEKNSDQAV